MTFKIAFIIFIYEQIYIYEHGVKIMNYQYHLENLGCPNCAAKIAEEINKLPEIKSADINFATATLFVEGNVNEATYQKMKTLIATIEDGCFIKEDAQEESPFKSKGFLKDFIQFLKEDLSKAEQILIPLSIFIFILSIFFEKQENQLHIFLALIAYFILAKNVFIQAIKNILRGDFFDENFLMAIATIGAIFIRQYEEAVGVMLFYQIGELFQDFASHRSRMQIRSSIDLRVETANLILSSGKTTPIHPDKLEIGQQILVNAGERCPVDGIIIQGSSQVDTSAITGESIPRRLSKGDEIYGGYLNLDGSLTLEVQKKASESMAARILRSVEEATINKPKMERFITRFSRIYTPIVCLIALLTAIIPSLISGNWQYWIYTALTFLVISCPCALVLSVPLSFFSGLGLASKHGILFKGASVLEELAHIQSIAIDKTGTLTEGNFKVQEILSTSGVHQEDVLAIAKGMELHSNHPIAKAIAQMNPTQLSKFIFETIEEKSGHGLIGKYEEDYYYLGNEKLMKLYHIEVSNIFVPKSIGSRLYLAKNQELIGLLVLSDTIKEDAKETINKLNQLSIPTTMLTGDIQETAQEVSQFLGISGFYSQLLPDDKLRMVQELRAKYGSILFIGDGINDTPVMAGANVGAAFGDGSDAAIEVCDLVYLQPTTLSIVKSIEIAKLTLQTAYRSVALALIVKIGVMILGLLGFSNMWIAVFADSGVSLICVLYAASLLRKK